jgi:predicted metal-binding protein
MPRCQGRPDSDCPHDVNDDSVKFTQGDLFLCPECEEFRFPRASNAKGGNRKGGRKPVHAGAGAKSNVDVHQLDQCAMHPAPGTGACEASECIAPDKSAALRCDTCQGLFHGECLGISHQTLAKFAEIIHITGWVCVNCREVVRNQLNMLHAGQRSLTDAVEQLKTVVTKLQQEITSVGKASESTDHQPAAWPSLPVSKEQKKQLLAVVHNDFDDSKRRQCNVVVSGVAPVDGISDVDLFIRICENNLTVKPFVVRNKCRRLGRPQPGKIQPLLIRLNNPDAATDLLKAAKQLRRSEDETVSRQVFINPDLTPGEAQAAFERRQKRRQRLQRHPAVGDDAAEVSAQPGAGLLQRPRVDNYGTHDASHGEGHDANDSDDEDDGNIMRRAPVGSRPLSADAAPFTSGGRVPSVS